MSSMIYSNYDNNEEEFVEQRFEKMYPNYDYSLEPSSRKKDTRKRMKTMYQILFQGPKCCCSSIN